MKAIILFACALAMATPAAAQTVEELKAQLDAQLQINALLKQRIRTLEAEAANDAAQTAAAPLPAARPDDAPGREAHDSEEDRALQRALVRRGNVVLAHYVVEMAPGLLWSHSDSDMDGSVRRPVRRHAGCAYRPARWLDGGRASASPVPIKRRIR